MGVLSEEQFEQLFLLGRHVLLIPLSKGEQGLVPHERGGTRLRLKPEEVRDEGVNDLEGQGIALLNQGPDDDAVGPGVRHLSDLEEGHRRGEDGDGDLLQDRAKDERLKLSTVAI